MKKEKRKNNESILSDLLESRQVGILSLNFTDKIANKKSLWCPLFGDIPRFTLSSVHSPGARCVEIIKEARNLIGIYDPKAEHLYKRKPKSEDWPNPDDLNIIKPVILVARAVVTAHYLKNTIGPWVRLCLSAAAKVYVHDEEITINECRPLFLRDFSLDRLDTDALIYYIRAMFPLDERDIVENVPDEVFLLSLAIAEARYGLYIVEHSLLVGEETDIQDPDADDNLAVLKQAQIAGNLLRDAEELVHNNNSRKKDEQIAAMAKPAKLGLEFERGRSLPRVRDSLHRLIAQEFERYYKKNNKFPTYLHIFNHLKSLPHSERHIIQEIDIDTIFWTNKKDKKPGETTIHQLQKRLTSIRNKYSK